MPEQDTNNSAVIIKPERQGLWTAVTFTLALLGLVAALTGVFRVYELTHVTQAEFVMLRDKVNNLQAYHPTPTVPSAVPGTVK